MKDAATAASSMPTSVFSRPCKLVVGLCSSAVGRRSSTRRRHAPLCFRIHRPPPCLHRSRRRRDPPIRHLRCPLRYVDPEPPARGPPPSTGPAPQRAALPSQAAFPSRPSGCEKFFGTSLFILGEFGVNDYHFSFAKSMQEIMSLISDVIGTISMAIERLIKHGTKSFVVPGAIPAGCVPQILNCFAKDDPTEYNSTTGFLEGYNKQGMHHNLLLQEALEKLRGRYPGVTMFYADLFGPLMEMVESPGKFGFEEDALTMCCGGPGTLICGDAGANICKKPSACLFWDDVHLTEAAYRYIANRWLQSTDSPATATARASS